MNQRMIFPFSSESLSMAVSLLYQGTYIALPTETVYGLAADATSDAAVAKIYSLKKRPSFNPLIAHFSDLGQLEPYVELTPLAKKLLHLFAPGPLTLVLKKKKDAPVCDLVTAGLDTLAVRIPAHPIAQKIIQKFGKPLAAPSANPSESLSPTLASHVEEAFRSAASPPLILDGGPCQKGLESTILDARFDNPVLLRPGSLSLENIEAKSEIKVHKKNSNEKISAPGQLARHYAPHTPVELNVTTPDPEAAFLAFGPTDFKGEAFQQLSATKNLEEAAANLFSMLRVLDAYNKKIIQISPIPQKELGFSINDRLKRASYSKK